MGILKTADFYYGSFLSALLNYAGKKPSLFDQIPKSPDRRIYRLTTENSPKDKDYIIYTKYTTARKTKREDFYHWVFPLSQEELQKMIDFRQQGYSVKFAFICAQPDLKDSELALVDHDQVVECTGVSKGIKGKGYRVNIKAINGKHGLRMYGSGLSDNNALKVSRDALKDL